MPLQQSFWTKTLAKNQTYNQIHTQNCLLSSWVSPTLKVIGHLFIVFVIKLYFFFLWPDMTSSNMSQMLTFSESNWKFSFLENEAGMSKPKGSRKVGICFVLFCWWGFRSLVRSNGIISLKKGQNRGGGIKKKGQNIGKIEIQLLELYKSKTFKILHQNAKQTNK